MNCFCWLCEECDCGYVSECFYEVVVGNFVFDMWFVIGVVVVVSVVSYKVLWCWEW